MRNSTILRTIPLLIAVCLVGLPGQALYGGMPASPETSTYIFLPGQSTVVQTGGIAGVHWTYTVEGRFRLAIDRDAGTASFARVDANATDDSPFQRTLDPSHVFSLTALADTVVDDTTISFAGKAPDGSDVRITVTLQDDLAHLIGQTTPPPNSADFFVFSLDAVAQRKYSGGTGEPNDPYQIATAADLIAIGETPEDYDKHFILTADIDLDPNLPSGRVFDRAVIAPDLDEATSEFQGMAFTGHLDGEGHVIMGLTIESTSEYAGLLGLIGSDATVRRLHLVGGSIRGDAYLPPRVPGRRCGTGALAGENRGSILDCCCDMTVNGTSDVGGLAGENRGSVLNSYSTGSVHGTDDNVGGLVGYNQGGFVSNSYSTAPVNGMNKNVGGLVGHNQEGSVSNSYSMGSVDGTDKNVGGLVGHNQRGSVSNSYSTGSVTGTYNNVGGLVGHNQEGLVLDCYSTSSVTGTQNLVGGLVGYNQEGLVSDCYSTGSVDGLMTVGGLVGCNRYGNVVDSHSTGSVNGMNTVGGLVGLNDIGVISNSLSTGSVGGLDLIGGLVGLNDAEGFVLNCCSTGLVDGSSGVGGLVGLNNIGVVSNSYSTGSVNGTFAVGGLLGDNRGTVSNSFWDMETSGVPVSRGGVGLTTAEMQDPGTYLDAGWDFLGEWENGLCEIWLMPTEGGYPELGVFNGHVAPELPGAGNLDDPYVVKTPEDLGTVSYRPAACYRLTADIDLSGIVWSTAVVPIFRGTFEGHGHRIRNMTICGGGYLGFFGSVARDAVVFGLGLEDANVVGTGLYVGSLAGHNRGTISDSHSTGTVSGHHNVVGGLVGCSYGSIATSYSSGATSGRLCVGGLLGRGGNITASYSRGTVSGDLWVGGLVGLGGNITTSYSACTVDGDERVGGLVGWGLGEVTASFWDIETSGRTSSDGGTGKTTTKMQTARTFLEAGWDFVGETDNGTDDLWWILEGQDYPRLWWELGEETR